MMRFFQQMAAKLYHNPASFFTTSSTTTASLYLGNPMDPPDVVGVDLGSARPTQLPGRSKSECLIDKRQKLVVSEDIKLCNNGTFLN